MATWGTDRQHLVTARNGNKGHRRQQLVTAKNGNKGHGQTAISDS